MDKAREAARAALDSALLIMLARLVTLIGIPALLTWFYWINGDVTALSRRMSVMEAQRVQGRAELVTRLERLETSDARDREATSAMQQRLASVDATTQAILREIETMRREAILREQRVAR